VGDFIKYLEGLALNLRTLSEDIANLIQKKEKERVVASDTERVQEAESVQQQGGFSSKSLQLTVKLRRSVEEIEKADTDPDGAFVMDQISKIFS
jgi:hypothetical protein